MMSIGNFEEEKIPDPRNVADGMVAHRQLSKSSSKKNFNNYQMFKGLNQSESLDQRLKDAEESKKSEVICNSNNENVNLSGYEEGASSAFEPEAEAEAEEEELKNDLPELSDEEYGIESIDVNDGKDDSELIERVISFKHIQNRQMSIEQGLDP